MNKIKIVILAKNKYDNYQINNIIKNLKFKKLDITILYSNTNYLLKKSFLYRSLFKIIFFIEKRFINNDHSLHTRKEIIINKKNQSIDQYFDNKLKKKKEFSTDVILNLGHHVINYNFLKNVKFGLWYLDNSVKDNFYIGFYDCLFSKKTTSSLLFKKSFFKNKIITCCIDKARLNNKINFWLRNRQFIIDKSSSLFFKNLNLIFYGLKFNNDRLIHNKKPLEITLVYLFYYFFNKYIFNFLKRLNLFENKDKSLWSLHILDSKKNYIKNFNNIINQSIRIKPPKNSEWADPFIYSHNNKNYVFFENKDLIIGKGKISYGELYQNKLINIKDILNLKFHLSYPFIWKYNNNFYLIPESSEKKSLHIWKAKNFPNKWVFFKTLLKNEFCCDTTIIQDKSKNNWLLTNKSNNNLDGLCDELYVYKIIGDFKRLIPHQLNPVITDCLTARNAGKLIGGKELYRPSQINDSNGYGIGLNINKISILNLSTYKEKNIKKIIPNKIKNADGLHHINNSNKHIIFDVRYKI